MNVTNQNANPSNSNKRELTSQAQVQTSRNSKPHPFYHRLEEFQPEGTRRSPPDERRRTKVIHLRDIFSDNPNTVLEALVAVRDSCGMVNEALVRKFASDAVFIVKKWPQQGRIQSLACQLFAVVIGRVDVDFAFQQETAKIVAQAMKDHRDDRILQVSALGALGCMCQSEKIARHIVQIAEIFEFEENRNDPCVVGHLCFLLHRLAVYQAIRQEIVQAQGFSILRQCLVLHGIDSAVRQTVSRERGQSHVLFALGALRSLSLRVEKQEEGCGRRIIAYMMQQRNIVLAFLYPATEGVDDFTPISFPTVEAKKLIMDAVVAAMKSFPECCELHDNSFFVMAKFCLASHEIAAHCVENLKILPYVQRTFENFQHDAGFVDSACSLLKSMSTHQLDCKDSGADGDIVVLCEAVDFYRSDDNETAMA